MKRKDRVKTTGADWDVFTRWRRWLCWCYRPGATSWVKRNYRRRCRRNAKKEVQMSYDIVIDPASPDGDKSCIVYYTRNDDGGITVVDMESFDAE